MKLPNLSRRDHIPGLILNVIIPTIAALALLVVIVLLIHESLQPAGQPAPTGESSPIGGGYGNASTDR